MKLKRLLSSALLLTLTMFTLGCSDAKTSEADRAVYHQLSPEEAHKRLSTAPAPLLLDVRTAEEYAAGHIKNAVLLPLAELADKAPQVIPDKSTEILIYCRSGRRSRQAAEALVAAGYTAVYDFGGLLSWPYETVTD